MLGQDAEGPQSLAALGPAVLVAHVLFVFLAEIFDGGKHGVGGAVPQAAERTGHDHLAHLLEPLDVAFFPEAGRDLVQELVHLPGADAAGRALAAGLALGKGEEVLGHVHHAVVLVQDHHAAGAHDRAHAGQGIEVHRHVEELGRDAAARRTAGLDRLELLVRVQHAAADVEDDLPERDAHGHFDEARVLDLAGQGEHFRALRFLRADRV